MYGERWVIDMPADLEKNKGLSGMIYWQLEIGGGGPNFFFLSLYASPSNVLQTKCSSSLYNDNVSPPCIYVQGCYRSCSRHNFGLCTNQKTVITFWKRPERVWWLLDTLRIGGVLLEVRICLSYWLLVEGSWGLDCPAAYEVRRSTSELDHSMLRGSNYFLHADQRLNCPFTSAWELWDRAEVCLVASTVA